MKITIIGDLPGLAEQPQLAQLQPNPFPRMLAYVGQGLTEPVGGGFRQAHLPAQLPLGQTAKILVLVFCTRPNAGSR